VTKPLGEHRIHDKKANCLGLQGLDRAIQNGVSEVAVFLAASEAFNKANLGCSIPDSLSRSPPPRSGPQFTSPFKQLAKLPGQLRPLSHPVRQKKVQLPSVKCAS